MNGATYPNMSEWRVAPRLPRPDYTLPPTPSSSFTAQRATPGEPPQSAQDKARMDKEYLSLMAELGEAPVPSSGGGHSHQGGGNRSNNSNNSTVTG